MTVPDATAPPSYCGHCGQALAHGADGSHQSCDTRLALEPPRYCGHCGRRMKVQVTPRTWSATCVEHGTLSGG